MAAPPTPSSLGFGTQRWSRFPFGSSDWSEEVLWRVIPEFYKILDLHGEGRVNQPLRGFIDAIKPSLEDLRHKVRLFPTLWDADLSPVNQLPSLARAIGLQPSTDKPEVFQRLEILNAHQLYLHKGTDKGYRIVASFDGLTVDITGLWAETCEPDALLTPNAPEHWMANFDDIPADEIQLDSIYTDRFALWPESLTDSVHVPGEVFFDEIPLDAVPLDAGLEITEGRCRSHSLTLYFYKPDDTEIEDFEAVARRVVKFVAFMKPIHVTIESLTFDGPNASSTWVGHIKADAPAAATWVGPVSGALLSSATWVSLIDSTPAP